MIRLPTHKTPNILAIIVIFLEVHEAREAI